MNVLDGGKFGADDFKSKYESGVGAGAGFVAHGQQSNVKRLAVEESIQWPIPQLVRSGVEKRTGLRIYGSLPEIAHRALLPPDPHVEMPTLFRTIVLFWLRSFVSLPPTKVSPNSHTLLRGPIAIE